MSTPITAEHIVVGAGINGLLAAYYLHQQGCEVIVLDRQEVGQEASWAGGGILSPLFPWRYPQAVTDLVQWSQAHYPALCEELTRISGIDPEWTLSGMIVVEPMTALIKAWGIDTQTVLQVVNNTALQELEPQISRKYESAIWMPEVAQVRNPRLVKSLKQALLSLGVNIKDHTEVIDILRNGDQVCGVRTNQGDIMGSKVLITCGAWSAEMIASMGVAIDVEPVRGQMLLIEAEPDWLRHIILADDHYLIPRRDGKILVGSTLEYVGFNKNTTQNARDLLTRVAENIAPCLTRFKIIKHWAGLRPGSKSNIPTISEHPRIQGLFVNAGHFRNGVVMAPASAKLLVDLVTSKPTGVNPMFYRMNNPY